MSKTLKFLFVCVLCVVVLLLLVSVHDEGDDKPGVVAMELSSKLKSVSTSDVVNGRFYSKSSNSSWVHGDGLSWVSRSGDLVLVTGLPELQHGVLENKRVVVSSGQFVGRPWKVKFSPDNTYVLIGFEPRRLFRSTILARYAVHSMATGHLITQLTTTLDSPHPESFQAAVWCGNDTVVVTHKNDLYAIQLIAQGSTRVKRITADGSDTLTNGVADWVYEEEIYTQSSTTIYPSPEGKLVAYMKFNDTEVTPVTYSLYGDYSQDPYFDEYFQYPKFGSVRYPKSGTRNPTVSVHVFMVHQPYCWAETTSSCSWDINLNQLMVKLGKKPENYIAGPFHWLNDKTFALQVLNRVQNSSWLLSCDVVARGCSVLREWEQEHGWIDVSQIVSYGSELLTLMSVGGGGSTSDGGNVLEYNHVARIRDEQLMQFATTGSWSVDMIVGVFQHVLIIKSPLLKETAEGIMLSDPAQTHYYALNLNNSQSQPHCLTCYSDCTVSTAKFSPSGSYFINTCERQHTVLHVDLIHLNLSTLQVTSVAKLEENKQLDTLLSTYELPEPSYFTYEYKLKGTTYKMRCRVLGRKGWQQRQGLATIVDVYGGPSSQKVTKKFTPNDWSYSITSNHDVVYLTIDGIGSGRQSNSLSFEVYRDLGNHEIHDKIYVLQQFLNEHKNLDPKKTLIWGWSYGGYLSAMVMGKDTQGVFNCGISVAPVVNWNYYDTIYTERYMSTPEDNPSAYNSSNVLQYLSNFRNKPYLLVHGNADDNVHYQQSMVLARGLEQQAIQFRMHSYPDENHSLGGVRPHLFAMLEDFVLHQCFKTEYTTI